MNTREIAADYRLAHWAQVMQNREASGLSVRAYCKQAGFHENNYFYWQRKLREASCKELARVESGNHELAPYGFAEVKLASANTYPPAASADRNQISVEAAGLRIVAGVGYPIDNLAYLLREVMQRC